MSSFAADVRAAWEKRVARQIVVPEWNRTLYVYALTIGQASRIYAETDPILRAARIVQTRAKQENGLPVFDQDDFDTLVGYGIGGYGPEVIARVAAEIMADNVTAENVEKN